MAQVKNKFVIHCHPSDLDFLVENYKEVALDCVREFDLPDDTMVKLNPTEACRKNRVRTYFNGEYLGDIVIRNENPEPTDTIIQQDKGLH